MAERIISQLVVVFVMSSGVFAQDYPHEKTAYSFIDYENNTLDFYGDDTSFKNLFGRIDTLLWDGTGQVNIAHMGGSHIQGGIWSDNMRKKFQALASGVQAHRGFLFPFRMAKTNNPSNYNVVYNGNWESCRNVEKNKNCTLGLSGMSVTTQDSSTWLRITLKSGSMPYDFRTVKIFHDIDSNSYAIVPKDSLFQKEVNVELGYTSFTFDHWQDSLEISFIKTDSLQDHFTLYGLTLETEDPGFVYHAIGVNGASVPSYLRCDLLEEHAQSLNIDLIIFSIGINDAYGPSSRFSTSYFKANYDQLIEKIKTRSPNISIIFTTNNDSYYKRRYVNKNGARVQKAMIELAKKHNAAVWDLYKVMGGHNSIAEWEAHGLAKPDKVHFTKDGYTLVSDLFFSAFVKSYEKHLETTF